MNQKKKKKSLSFKVSSCKKFTNQVFFFFFWVVFNYKPRAHNVITVNGTEFKQCAAPLGAAPLTSGHDVITLAAPGRKWYICGFPDHCHTGQMKFAITVQPGLGSPSPAPALTPPKPDAGAATGFGPSKTLSWMIAALAAFMMIMA